MHVEADVVTYVVREETDQCLCSPLGVSSISIIVCIVSGATHIPRHIESEILQILLEHVLCG